MDQSAELSLDYSRPRWKVKRLKSAYAYSSLWETHRRTTERHMPYGITQTQNR